MAATRQQLGETLDRYATRPMFVAALLSLLVLAALTHRLRDIDLVSDLEIYLIVGTAFALWPIFLLEAVVRFLARSGDPLRRRLVAAGFVVLIPPLRLGYHGYARANEIWLPGLGWRLIDRKLRQKLEKIFSVPMVVLALLTLPVLGIETLWETEVKARPWLAFVLDVSIAVIWLGFAVELIIQTSVAEKRVSYLLRHWLDLAIVLLPIIEAMPAIRSLRALRVLRVEQVTRFGRAYRLRALMIKLWHAFLLLEVIQRVSGQSPAKRLARLRGLLTAKEEELADLRTEIEQLEQQIAKSAKPAPGSPGPCGPDASKVARPQGPGLPNEIGAVKEIEPAA